MPVSSAEIAQQAMMNYQQFHMMNSSYGYADQLTGEAINAIGSSVRPLVGGTAGLLGATPEAVFMGVGLNAGISAFQGGAGIAGAIGTGLGAGALAAAPVALGAAALGATANWVGGNLMQGAQDQQRLNMAMGQSYGFYNQQGGRGFTRTQLGQIGSEMREMTHHTGPGGELTSMRELTDIAAKMGQMGMGKGIRDAQEFNNKFRELVKTLKTVATDMNTSLGQALEFMQASKASGMFTTSDQARFAKTVQQTAASSGLATSEVTAAANIGSQISRSFGGLGRQGAMGGARAIGQIGAAVQAGALSEEDIYNATGLSGAEGRQALASNMMAQTGSFLKSGKGRYMLAALAGKDGTIDEDAAKRFMTGNVGVGETRQLAGQHLGDIGRANFIRNEGRLRGAVMERFGAMAPAMALKGWASQRGIDINDMDDRSMLFAQRQLGMGRDELDAAMSMAQRMPEIARQQMGAQRDADYSRALGMDQKQRGMEGLKRRFDKAKEDINSKLQAAGQSIYTETAEYVERWLNRSMGHTVSATTENLGELYRRTLLGGQSGRDLSQSLFGGWGAGRQNKEGQKVLKEWEKSAGAKGTWGGDASATSLWQGFAGPSRLSFGDTVAQETRDWAKVGSAAGLGGAALLGSMGAQYGILKSIGQTVTDWAGGAGRQRKQLEAAGFKFDEIEKMQGADRDKALQKKLDNISNMSQLLGGEGSLGEVKMSQGLKSKLLESYAGGELSRASTEDRPKALRALLAQEAKSNPDAAKQLEEFDRAGPTGQMLMVARTEETIGKKTGGVRENIQNAGDPNTMLLNRGRYATVGEADEAYGRAILGRRDKSFTSHIVDARNRSQEKAGIRGMQWMGLAAPVAASAALEGLQTYSKEKLGGGLLGHLAEGALGGSYGMGALGGFVKWAWGGGQKEKGREAAVGEAARSEGGMKLVGDVWNGIEGGRERAMQVLANRKAGEELKPMETLAAGSLIATQIAQEASLAGGIDKIPTEKREAILKQAKNFGMNGNTFEEIKDSSLASISTFMQKQEANRRDVIDRTRKEIQTESLGGVKSGVLTVGKDGKYKLSEAREKKIKELGPAAAAAMTLGKEYLSIQNNMQDAQALRAKGDEQGARELENKAMMTRQEMGESLTRAKGAREGEFKYRSIEEMKSIAKGLEGTGAGDLAEYEVSIAQRLQSQSRRGGLGVGIASAMGARVDRKEAGRLQKAFGQGIEAYGVELAKTMGISGEAREEMMKSKDFQEAFKAAKGGGVADTARLLETLKASGGKLGKELEEKKESRMDPQSKMVASLDKIAKAMDAQSQAAANNGLASAIATALSNTTLKVSDAGKGGSTNAEGGKG